MDVRTVDTHPNRNQLLAALSEEELQWYDKFQNGLVFFSGWKKISEEILSCIPEDRRIETREMLENIGVRIGTEWSKANGIRKIDTDQLRSWGSRLRKARSKGAQQLSSTLKIISTEVDAILARDRTNLSSSPLNDNLQQSGAISEAGSRQLR